MLWFEFCAWDFHQLFATVISDWRRLLPQCGWWCGLWRIITISHQAQLAQERLFPGRLYSGHVWSIADRGWVLTCRQKALRAGMGTMAAMNNARALPSDVTITHTPFCLRQTPVFSWNQKINTFMYLWFLKQLAIQYQSQMVIMRNLL